MASLVPLGYCSQPWEPTTTSGNSFVQFFGEASEDASTWEQLFGLPSLPRNHAQLTSPCLLDKLMLQADPRLTGRPHRAVVIAAVEILGGIPRPRTWKAPSPAYTPLSPAAQYTHQYAYPPQCLKFPVERWKSNLSVLSSVISHRRQQPGSTKVRSGTSSGRQNMKSLAQNRPASAWSTSLAHFWRHRTGK